MFPFRDQTLVWLGSLPENYTKRDVIHFKRLLHQIDVWPTISHPLGDENA